MVIAGGKEVVDTAVSIVVVPATHTPTDPMKVVIGAPLRMVHVASMP